MKVLFYGCLFLAVATSCAAHKIQDCPEAKIINRMPTIGESSKPSEYYIYQGKRKELSDFDQNWVKKNCPNLKVETVY